MTKKYDFPGMKKAGSVAFKALLASTTWGASILAGPLAKLVDPLTGALSEWLANKGLLVVNLGAVVIEGKIDQGRFDRAMEEALERIKIGTLTEEQKQEIDNEVIEAFRRFGRITRK